VSRLLGKPDLGLTGGDLPRRGVSERVPLLSAVASGLAGLALLGAGLAKLIHPEDFAAYLQGAWSCSRELAHVGALCVAGLEALIGIALAVLAVLRVAGPIGRGPCWAALALGVVFLADASLRLDDDPGCGCFGKLLEATRAARLGFAGLVVVLLGVSLLFGLGAGLEERSGQNE